MAQVKLVQKVASSWSLGLIYSLPKLTLGYSPPRLRDKASWVAMTKLESDFHDQGGRCMSNCKDVVLVNLYDANAGYLGLLQCETQILIFR